MRLEGLATSWLASRHCTATLKLVGSILLFIIQLDVNLAAVVGTMQAS